MAGSMSSSISAGIATGMSGSITSGMAASSISSGMTGSMAEGMTGIVYTDEGGEEQSLLGKLVYTTDEMGSSNIILQVMFRKESFLIWLTESCIYSSHK